MSFSYELGNAFGTYICDPETDRQASMVILGNGGIIQKETEICVLNHCDNKIKMQVSPLFIKLEAISSRRMGK